MGLAASQARFLGITLRKANCEYKSTELAQQRLELTNQMTDISQDYANAMNATKLVWHNEAVCDSFGNPMDFGLSYGLLMMPSASNDYTPYMLASRSGAIVLNAKYADAAEYAGISMAGGTPSAAGRKKFLAALANQAGIAANIRSTGQNDNIITAETYNILEPATPNSSVAWHYSAGMGAAPKDKGVADITTITDLILDENIGGQKIDWLEIYKAALGKTSAITENEKNKSLKYYTDIIAQDKLNYINYEDSTNQHPVWATTANAQQAEKDAIEALSISGTNVSVNPGKTGTAIMERFKYLEGLISNSSTGTAARMQYENELENLKRGYDASGNLINGTEESKVKYPLYWDVYEKVKAEAKQNSATISWSSTTNNDSSVIFDNLIYTNSNNDIGGAGSAGNKGIQLTNSERKLDYLNIFTLCRNNSFLKDENSIKNLTIGDLFKYNITIIAQETNGQKPLKAIEIAGNALLESIAKVFGYGHIGTGLNIDSTSNEALEMALNMTKKKFLKAGNVVKGNGESDSELKSNGAYVNAQDYNRIGGTNNEEYAALNISNMISAFLTYYDNFLRGSESGYVVGKSNKDGRTIFVTDDDKYAYVMNTQDEITNDEKVADFFNELYNNICEHGWRYDDMVIDNEYLESAVKDGRYQLMALNNADGYFYQQRYNDVGYMKEVRDDDAIARAEVAFTTKKAEITYKENNIDVRTKKLDAEITELNTEINSVQNIISKAIEKTFALFSN